jgi:hypothetical protein
MIVNPSPRDPSCKIESEYDATASTYRWSSGNGTGFRFAVTELAENLILLAWLWKGAGAAGPAMVFDLAGKCEIPYDASYVEEKMDISGPDAVAICQFMRHLFPDFQFRA